MIGEREKMTSPSGGIDRVKFTGYNLSHAGAPLLSEDSPTTRLSRQRFFTANLMNFLQSPKKYFPISILSQITQITQIKVVMLPYVPVDQPGFIMQ